MPKYRTPGWGTKKVEEIIKLLPKGTPFIITSDGEIEITLERTLTTSELNKLKSVLGKDLIKELT